MAFDLIETLKNLFNTEFAGKAASQLGESESGIQKALGGIIPTVLTGLLNKAGSGDAGGLMGLVRDAAGADLSKLGNIAGGLPAGLLAKGSEFLQSLFGNKSGDIAGAVASYAGIKPQSADTLMQAAAPAALGVIGKHAESTGLGTSGLLEMLNSQKDKILAAVPSGLGLAGLLGVGSLGDIGGKISSLAGSLKGAANSVGHSVEEAASGGSKWVTWLIIAIAAILLLWWLLRGCGAKEHTTVATADSLTVMEDTASHMAPAAAAPVVRESIKVTLPDGKVLDAYKGGIEDQLVQFLQNPNAAAGKDVWFDFDNLNFQTGSAQITPESQVQINNLAAILQAFPKTKIKVGGYTDATGDAKKNKQLSQDRATAVVTALSAANVKPVQLLGAEGYGSQFAKAAADAPDEERKLDRHISVSVREK
ncbi:DUF937 domain-containing protein [Chitinophaga caseinilytica]|uniref:DUF937 domain-containing protein n=1 Tax=Chitinophaga caseinilytica TaxID=2267521 RepID=UPI003C2AB29F